MLFNLRSLIHREIITYTCLTNSMWGLYSRVVLSLCRIPMSVCRYVKERGEREDRISQQATHFVNDATASSKLPSYSNERSDQQISALEER